MKEAIFGESSPPEFTPAQDRLIFRAKQIIDQAADPQREEGMVFKGGLDHERLSAISDERGKSSIFDHMPEIDKYIVSEARTTKVFVSPEDEGSWNGLYLEEKVTRYFDFNEIIVQIRIYEAIVDDSTGFLEEDWSVTLTEPIADPLTVARFQDILETK